MLEYHGQPQWQIVHRLLQPWCEEVVISVNQHQSKLWETESPYNFLVDNFTYQGHGPITGLLSVIGAYPDQAIFLVACDYPFLRRKHLKYLVDHRNQDYEVICYQQSGFPEPLITIFEAAATKKVPGFYVSGQDSIRLFIKLVNAKMVICEDPLALTNVNTLAEYQQLQSKPL